MEVLKVAVLMSVCYFASGDYRQDALRQHNELRSIHNARPLKLNAKLNRDASQYAQELVNKYLRSHSLKHSPGSSRPGVGESLSVGCTTARGVEGQTVQQAIKSWYDEVCQYNFKHYGFVRKLGHFSQLVWKDTTELGFGKKSGTYTDSKRRTWTCTYYVARYKAAGNVMSRRQFRENVDQGSFNRSWYCKAVKGDRRP
ncbi:Golgi-associated plant pathogenesis-related protein 1-like [Acropora palmata]